MGKAPCCDKNGLKKGPWTAEEDQLLVDYIKKNGYGRWRTLPKNAGLKRCGKSCRLRWTNYLRPDIKRGKFSIEEEDAIIQMHSILGNKWSVIASRLPGRTDNEIKNYWNTHIKKKLLRMGIDPVTHKPRLDLLQLYSLLSSSLYNNTSQINVSTLLGIGSMLNPNSLHLANFLPCQPNNQESNPKNDQLQTQIQQDHLIQGNSNITEFLNETTQYLQPSYFSAENSLNSLELVGKSSVLLPQWGNYEINNHPVINASSGENLSSLGFSALLSATPSANTTPLQSSSTTHVNGSTEDERESYSSNLLMFDTSNGFDVSGLL